MSFSSCINSRFGITDKAVQDREEVGKAVREGKDLEEASAPFVSEEAFENWYSSFCEALKTAVGEQG